MLRLRVAIALALRRLLRVCREGTERCVGRNGTQKVGKMMENEGRRVRRILRRACFLEVVCEAMGDNEEENRRPRRNARTTRNTTRF